MVLPVFSGYADGFWWRTLEDLPPVQITSSPRFDPRKTSGDDLQSKRPDIDALNLSYPFLTAEMGGGMENSYHRRPVLSPSDTAAMQVVKLGSGVVLYGYYMFHGGRTLRGRKRRCRNRRRRDIQTICRLNRMISGADRRIRSNECVFRSAEDAELISERLRQ